MAFRRPGETHKKGAFMNKFPVGSEWVKVDLHLHTPSSFDYKNKSITDDDIINKLNENDVKLAVITDHHRIDIKRIENLQSLGNKKGITILPGIELRSELGGSESIHFIGIFSDQIKLDDINTELQAKLNIKDSDISEKGDQIIYCTLKDASHLIHDLGGIISIHAGDKKNSIENITNALPYKMAQKGDIAELIDIFEMGKREDELDYKKYVFPSIGRIVPMILAPDNHKISEYNADRITWIKANPTFEGLKQILYEPESRVSTLINKPDEKLPYQIIKKVKFIDKSNKYNNFENEWIHLNQNLNSIIGGKSSGKSLLLYHIAKTIDENRINEINEDKNTGLIKYDYEDNDDFDFQVEWTDDVSYTLKTKNKPNRPITYIPQMYLNRLAEDKKDELNVLVEGMLTESNEGYKTVRFEIAEKIKIIRNSIQNEINKYFDIKHELEIKNDELKELGDNEAIKKSIQNITDEIQKLREESKFAKEDEDVYRSLTEKLGKTTNEISTNEYEIRTLEEAKRQISMVFDGIKKNLGGAFVDNLVSSAAINRNEIIETIKGIISRIVSTFDPIVIERTEKEFSIIDLRNENLEINKKKKEEIQVSLKPYLEKVKNQEQYLKLQKKLADEQTKQKNIEDKGKEISELEKKINIKKIIEYYKDIFNEYETIITKNSEYKNIPDTDNLELSSSVQFDLERFNELLIERINKKNSVTSQLGNYFDEDGWYIFESNGHVGNIDKMLNRILAVYVKLKTGITEKDIIEALLEDYFYIDYNLIQDNEELLKMSPGKRGIILFQLFLHLSKSTNPILIDQPEDNLDNRTVYQELNDFIKAKKTKRQIVIVSHNPNLVVSTDSENVIVANQEGQNKSATNKKCRFEYVSGSLECTYKDDSQKGILNTMGIREHVCEILEGGKTAFEKRENKYGFVKIK